ncbi:phage tail protein, partial [Photobacterium sp. OFAV2-7]|uniref:phage tail-collar fiber domain-containing protein n=1 Tax=Photobacterium sp. OFAV2-7 TaxID=2917748 RepID=UPI001EF4444E
MANTTDTKILTTAGKALLAQVNAEESPFKVDKLIFANIPDRADFPQPEDGVPTDYVVAEKAVERRGRLGPNVVIYSSTLTSAEGPYEFNWTGAYSTEKGVLIAIDHHKLTPKTENRPGIAGNTLVRSLSLEYKDIAEITNITVDATTWQYDSTKRLAKMDNDAAQANIDQNGKDWFIEDGFLVTPQDASFKIKAGAGYVSGNRVSMEYDSFIQVLEKPAFIYLDAWRDGTPTGEWETKYNFVVSADEQDDYFDGATDPATPHFVCKIAQVMGDGSVKDLRPEGESAGKEWVRKTAVQYVENKIEVLSGVFEAGSIVKTLGYYSAFDGGDDEYIISKVKMHELAFQTKNGLWANSQELKKKEVDIRKFGAIADCP